jgi:hypothetical protein
MTLSESSDTSGSPNSLGEHPSHPRLIKTIFSSSDFSLINRVRLEQQGGSDAYDVNADHYLLLDPSGKPIFVMRVNQARRGELDCENFYPKELLHNHRPVLCSASRFVRSRAFGPNVALAKHFLHLVREDQLLDGMVGDLINAHIPMVPYYQRLGYESVPGHDFTHPRLGTASRVMLLMVNAQGFAS